jgi:hypothetical protein
MTDVTTPTPRRALILIGSAFLLGALIVFAGLIPAEYGRDPIGFGNLTGISALWTPTETKVDAKVSTSAARSYPTPFRSDVVTIPLGVADLGQEYELEYKVHMKKGATLIYRWDVPGVANPEEIYTEFHGHTLESRDKMTVADYRKATGIQDNGALVAPFDGIHGWYVQNQSLKPVTLTLRLSGFYDLIPSGQPGNEAGLSAKRVVDSIEENPQ